MGIEQKVAVIRNFVICRTEAYFPIRAAVGSREGEAGAQATAQSERIKAWSAVNRFQAVSQASLMSARLRKTELASPWLRR